MFILLPLNAKSIFWNFYFSINIVQLQCTNTYILISILFAGKRWVECRDPDQISIPDQIDMETQVLDLSGINLQILSREVFARHGLLNLQKLHLSSCKIGQIDPTAFRGLTNLVELNLSGNLLTSVPTATFAGKLLQNQNIIFSIFFSILLYSGTPPPPPQFLTFILTPKLSL